ncbi:hypothetical protein TWF730_005389 [Orbilia blumenaviensis]|uniref:SnoaL-like domain-containing protein n=1 Tax=Orbilia blumenaviensis TaxID=1796055 RepID=A0AAV9VI88_9PEZI
MSSHYDSLLQAAESLCNDFATKADLPSMLSHYSPSATAFEHGDPHFAPFVGREFKGIDGITEYFGYLGRYLTYENMSFGEYFADERQNKVSVKGKGTFTWVSTGVKWDERFTYVLDFTREDGKLKVSRYQVWADTGALYLAKLSQRVEDIPATAE